MAGIPQVITEDRASGAQFIDGSLKFNSSKLQYLTRTPTTAGNRGKWTWSCWCKRGEKIGNANGAALFAAYSNNNDRDVIRYGGTATDSLDAQLRDGTNRGIYTTSKFRDTRWYHNVVTYDSAVGVKIYVNGVEQPKSNASGGNATLQTQINNTVEQYIGARKSGGNIEVGWDGYMGQVYLIDGLALGPGYFGFTDPLTGTWRPKKFEAEGTTANNGTTWSNFSSDPDNVIQSGAATALFDGNLSSGGVILNDTTTASDEWFIALDGVSIPCKDSVSFWSANGAGTATMRINGDNNLKVEAQTTTYGWWTLKFNGTINKIELAYLDGGSSNTYFGLAVDGVTLRDGVNQNLQFGTNGFYLPMDGNTPIGKDQSGRGNDWTPVAFGGFNTIEKATGALPILNTDGSGNSARPGTRTDEYASNIVMAIPFLQNVNDISADIKGSGSNLSVTTSGSPAADSDPYQWYGSSFNVSTGNYIDTIGTTSTFAFLHQPEAAGTIEGWINTNAVNVQGPWFQTSNGTDQVGVMFRQNSTTNLAVQINRGIAGQPIVIDSSITVAPNTWYHWAYVKSADGYAQFFLNGVPTGDKVPISTAAGASNAASTNTSSSFAGRIARNHGENRGIGANISDYRAYTIQKYAFDTPFIPASTNPDILPDTPSGVSGKSKLSKITDGAVSFDGSNSTLNITGQSDVAFGTGDFTLECYVYFSSSDGTLDSISETRSGNVDGFILGRFHTSGYEGKLVVYTDGNYRVPADSATPNNTWVHVAVVRSSSVTKLYIDGKAQSTTYSDSNNYSNDDLIIGENKDGSYQLHGFISNFRLIKDQALYTSDFTPPTEPLTTTSQSATASNVKLLCCQSTTQTAAAAVSPSIGGVNNGTVWSDYFTASDNFTSSGRGAGFDGSTSTLSQPATNSSSLTFAPPGGITYSTSVEVYTYQSNGVFTTVSDGAQSVSWTTLYQGWKTIASGGGTFTSTVLTSGNPSASDSRPSFAAIRVDGTILVDPVSVNGNASATNFNPFTDDINAIRGQETGYCTASPIDKGSLDLSNGNLRVERSSDTADWEIGRCTFRIPDTGRWYWEMTLSAGSNDGIYTGVGLKSADLSQEITGFWGYNSGGYAIYNTSYASSRPSMSVGDTACVSFDRDNNKMWVLINGTTTVYEGNPYSGTDPNSNWTNIPSDIYPVVGARSTGVGDYNFGQKPFKFPPPDGFQPLNISNVQPEKVIARPEQYVKAKLYNGNATPDHNIDVGFAPDLVIFGRRTNNAERFTYDTVRGAGKAIKPSTSPAAEEDQTGSLNFLRSFTSSGFTLGSDQDVNGGSDNYVAWCWKAGGKDGTNAFNIDDIGYANASDINMSVGALNSSTYDQSQTWTNYFAGRSLTDANNAFDGDTSTICQSPNNADAYLTLTYTFTNVTSLRVYALNPTNNQMRLNNTGSYTLESNLGASANSSWRDLTSLIPANGTVTHIEARNSGSNTNGVNWAAIEVNGRLLVNSGVTVANVPSIAATGCSVGTKQGFSVIKYQGDAGSDTVPHGLTQPPDFVLVKQLNNTGSEDWHVMHSAFGATHRGYFNTTAHFSETDNGFGDVNPTSSVFTVAYNGTNKSGSDYIAYCWHNVPGFQKFGTYIGVGQDNNFVELGFRPAMVWVKRAIANSSPDPSTNYSSWVIMDSSRLTYNGQTPNHLMMNKVVGEGYRGNGSNTSALGDMLLEPHSNGFYLNHYGSEVNSATSQYIYCAWAEAPNMNLYGAQANAR